MKPLRDSVRSSTTKTSAKPLISYTTPRTHKMTFSGYSHLSHFKVSPVSAGVVHVEINRPNVVNAFGPETWKQFHEVFHTLDSDSSVRAIVLSGRGKHFSSGLNLKETAGLLANVTDPEDYSFVEEFQKCINAPVEISKPVICVMHGVSFGLALDVATTASVRLTTKDARFSIKEVDIGIMADIGVLQRIGVLVGNVSKANELALTAEEFDGVKAKEIGLVSDFFDTKEDALQRAYKLAETISKKYVPAIAGTKKHLDQMNVGSDTVKAGLLSVAKDNTKLMTNPTYKKFSAQIVRKLGSRL